MAVDVERLIVRLEASQAKFEKQLSKANQTANKRARQIEGRFAQMNRRLGQSFSSLGKRFVGAFAAGFTVNEFKKLSDAATRIDNSLKVAGLSGAELEKVYSQLRDSAIANAAPLESLVELYSRASLVQKELGVNTQELLGFTDNIALALRVSGKSAAESSGALLQLSQALGSGTVRAEEFNSILEGALPIAQAAAAGLEEAGGSVAKLRQLVVDGEVSSEAFFRAFEAGSITLQEKVAGAQLTVSQAMGNLQTALIDTAREFNASTGASERFADGINDAAVAISEFDVSSFVDELNKAHGALVSFLNDLGNADVFKSLNETLGIADADGNMINLDAEEAKQEAASLEREVELLQETIAKNTEMGFDNSEALARLDEVSSRLAQVRAQLADMPTTMLDPISISAGAGPSDDEIMASENAKRKALGAGRKPETVSLSDFAAPPKRGGGGGGRRSRGGGSRQNDLQREIEQIKERTASLQAMTAAQATVNPLIDDYGFALERATAIAELENAAKKAGLEITPQLSEQIRQLATAYATASVESEKLAESQDNARQQADDLKDLGKDVLGGFINDLRNGVDAAEALEGALQKVADKLLDMALNNLIAGLFGGGFGGGGLLSIFGFAKGGIAAQGKPQPLPRFAKGGVARSASIFGEAGPEAAVPLPDGRRIPVDLRGPSASGSRGTSISMPLTINAPGADAAQLARVEESVKQLARNVPKMVDKRTDIRTTRNTRP